jgi:hypothetical protein
VPQRGEQKKVFPFTALAKKFTISRESFFRGTRGGKAPKRAFPGRELCMRTHCLEQIPRVSSCLRSYQALPIIVPTIRATPLKSPSRFSSWIGSFAFVPVPSIDSRIPPGLSEGEKLSLSRSWSDKSVWLITHPDGSDADVSDDLPRKLAVEFLRNPSSIWGMRVLFHPFFELSTTDPLCPAGARRGKHLPGLLGLSATRRETNHSIYHWHTIRASFELQRIISSHSFTKMDLRALSQHPKIKLFLLSALNRPNTITRNTFTREFFYFKSSRRGAHKCHLNQEAVQLIAVAAVKRERNPHGS